ncbi:MAG: hypothetical protein IKC79_00135 [Clostridia bacterium]|nr:hypothetical protein [Clostridia bacterium]
MKKSVVIIIAIIYIASIVSINFFGMKMSVYNEEIPVERIECINQSNPERGILVDEKNGMKRITLTYRGPGLPEAEPGTPQTPDFNGTCLFIEARVYPDNAINKDVRYQFKFTSKNVIFLKKENSEEQGVFLFNGLLGTTPITIVSKDGRNISTTILIRVVAPTSTE